ncbi:MAG TPA: hypothetical protein VJM31_02245 [Vicinamibacterales bacterium]|nr:hypothetical protein [Vicinamibacterales bacterium]
MAVRAKFRVHSILDFGISKEITMGAVYEGSLGENEENKRFTKATPNGQLKMTVDNPYASEQFAPGQEWYLNFELAEGV